MTAGSLTAVLQEDKTTLGQDIGQFLESAQGDFCLLAGLL